MRRSALAIVALLLAITPMGAIADPSPVPAPDPSVLTPALGDQCVAENPYEAAMSAQTSAAYGADCKRMRMAYGPIVVKPGQNDVLIGPVTVEKPAYDGFIVRFKPDLVDYRRVAPPIETVHLHHGTWLNAYPSYGDGPFFAAGEEKTIATFPKGYGMRVKPQDTWLLLFMVHNATAAPAVVWITYDIDFVAASSPAGQGIQNIKPMWLDVQKKAIAPGAPSTSGNPVFNVQRGFGNVDPETGLQVCTWPKQNCSRHDVYGDVTPQQGINTALPFPGADHSVNQILGSHQEATIVGLGGHLHPGGIRDEVSLYRNGTGKMIHISDAVYWNRPPSDIAQGAGPQNSWDFSMTATGSPLGWKVKIKRGDSIVLNAVQESGAASWYENMGIVVAYVTDGPDRHAPYGVDVFDDDVTIDPGVAVNNGVLHPAGWRMGNWIAADHPCVNKLEGTDKRLCLRGGVTHGHLQEASNFGGTGLRPLIAGDGPFITDVHLGAFTYGETDFAVIGATGVPRVRKGSKLTFWNPDSAVDIWHTITRCAEPCTAATGLSYPLADGGIGATDQMDFDSTEIGYGVFFSPASGQIGGSKETEEVVRDGIMWEFNVPADAATQVYTFWCRIHPSMRGAFKVVD